MGFADVVGEDFSGSIFRESSRAEAKKHSRSELVQVNTFLTQGPPTPPAPYFPSLSFLKVRPDRPT